MPIPVKAYTCSFRCGRKSTTHRKDMEAHEARCKLNPQARSCPTCRHEGFENGYPGSYEEPPEKSYWYCDIEQLPNGVQIAYGCPSWEERKG